VILDGKIRKEYNHNFGWQVNIPATLKEKGTYESFTIHPKTLREMQSR
jgi:hypothetical protein